MENVRKERRWRKLGLGEKMMLYNEEGCYIKEKNSVNIGWGQIVKNLRT